MFLLVFLVLGSIIGYLQGGRWSSFSVTKLRFGFLVFVALAVQISVHLSNIDITSKAGLVAHILSYLLVIAFLFLNVQIRWAEVIAFGLMLNLIPVLLTDGDMLYSSIAFSGSYHGAPYATDTMSEMFWFLGELFSLPKELPLHYTFSAGDIMIWSGLFGISREMMLARSIRPNVVWVRYRPRHLVRANNQFCQ